MQFWVISILTTLITVSVADAQCPEVGGVTIPCGNNTQATTALTPDQTKQQLTLIEPLFTPDNVARDAPPEQIEMLNHLTWENAHKAAVSRLYRNYKIFVAMQMITAVKDAIVNDVKQRHQLTDEDHMQILKIVAQEHGLPTINLDAVGLAPASLSDAATKALRAISTGGQP